MLIHHPFGPYGQGGSSDRSQTNGVRTCQRSRRVETAQSVCFNLCVPNSPYSLKKKKKKIKNGFL